MPGEVVTLSVGFSANCRRTATSSVAGLPAAVATRLDDWLQTEFGRSDDPAAMLAALEPVRFASSALAEGELALGAMIASSDRVARTYLLMALRLAPHPSGVLPEPVPGAWDDWCGRAEALLVAARDGGWTADATQAALETATRAAVVERIAAAPFSVPDDRKPMTASWRPTLGLVDRRSERVDGVPRGAEFDRFIAAAESD